MAVLRIKDDEGERTLTLDKPMMTAGRSSENEIVIKSNQSSRRHFQIEKVDAGFKLVDLESRNGTKVNGKFVNQHLLMHGDKVSIGTIEIEFDDPETTARTAPVDSPEAMQKIAEGQMRDRNLSAHAAQQRAAAPRPRRPGSTVSTMDPEEREILVSKQKESRLIKNVAIGAGILVGALVLLVIFNELSKVPPEVKDGESHYRAALQLKEQGNFDAAMDHLRRIKPEAGEWHRKAQPLIAELQPLIHDQRIDETSALHKEFVELQLFYSVNIQKHAEILARIKAFEEKYKGQLTRHYLNAIEGERGRIQRDQLSIRTRDMDGFRKRVADLIEGRRYADAMKECIDTMRKFTDPESRSEIDKIKTDLTKKAQEHFTEEDNRAQDLLKEGKDNEAQAIYELLMDEFSSSGPYADTEFETIRKAIKARLGIGE